jgi:hypothetical protein
LDSVSRTDLKIQNTCNISPADEAKAQGIFGKCETKVLGVLEAYDGMMV